MPNIATALKDEIVRLARKELRKELEGLKKASTQYRSEIAALKRGMVALEKQVTHLGKKDNKKESSGAGSELTGRVRFSAKGLFGQRKRLGLSAASMGMLLGVSAQTVYNWEAGKTRPRQQQMAAIAAIKKIGKRQARAQLEEDAE